MVSDEANRIMYKYIYLEAAIKVLEQDRLKIRNTKFPHLYEKYIEWLGYRISKDLHETKREMRRGKMKAHYVGLDHKEATNWLVYMFYEGIAETEHRIWDSVFRQNVEKVLHSYAKMK